MKILGMSIPIFVATVTIVTGIILYASLSWAYSPKTTPPDESAAEADET